MIKDHSNKTHFITDNKRDVFITKLNELIEKKE